MYEIEHLLRFNIILGEKVASLEMILFSFTIISGRKMLDNFNNPLFFYGQMIRYPSLYYKSPSLTALMT